MPYQSAKGTVPDFQFPIVSKPNYLHGELQSCCCFALCIKCCNFELCYPEVKCCGIDIYCCKDCVRPMIDVPACCTCICTPCIVPCQPCCGLLLNCEAKVKAFCEGLCNFGPEVECKAVGCELTAGQAAIEGLCGVWHVSSEAFPGPLPSILFPCCCGPCCPCPGGVDETLNGDTFAKGSPPTTKKMFALDWCCGSMRASCILCLSCHTRINDPCYGLSPIGLCSNPAFGGAAGPFWYTICNKCVYPSVKFGPPTFAFTPPSFAIVPCKLVQFLGLFPLSLLGLGPFLTGGGAKVGASS